MSHFTIIASKEIYNHLKFSTSHTKISEIHYLLILNNQKSQEFQRMISHITLIETSYKVFLSFMGHKEDTPLS